MTEQTPTGPADLAVIIERVKLANPTYMSEQRELVDEIERLRAELRIANEQIRGLIR